MLIILFIIIVLSLFIYSNKESFKNIDQYDVLSIKFKTKYVGVEGDKMILSDKVGKNHQFQLMRMSQQTYAIKVFNTNKFISINKSGILIKSGREVGDDEQIMINNFRNNKTALKSKKHNVYLTIDNGNFGVNTNVSDKSLFVLEGIDLPVKIKYDYIGCFKDAKERDFKFGPKNYGYTKDTCAKACKDNVYFALQNDGLCFCNNNPPRYEKKEETECGEKGMGGEMRNSVYKINRQIIGDSYDPDQQNELYSAHQDSLDDMEDDFDPSLEPDKCNFEARGPTKLACVDKCSNRYKRYLWGGEECTRDNCTEICDNCTKPGVCHWLKDEIEVINKPEPPKIKCYSLDKKVKVTWSNPYTKYPIIGYTIFITNLSNTDEDVRLDYMDSPNCTTCEYYIFNVVNNQRYQIHVKSKNKFGYSENSNKVIIIPDASNPEDSIEKKEWVWEKDETNRTKLNDDLPKYAKDYFLTNKDINSLSNTIVNNNNILADEYDINLFI